MKTSDAPRHEPGYHGAFTRAQAEGAIPNATRIRKARMEAGDGTPIGTGGVILGSLLHEGMHAYFVEWDNRPRMAVFVVGWKIEREAP